MIIRASRVATKAWELAMMIVNMSVKCGLTGRLFTHTRSDRVITPVPVLPLSRWLPIGHARCLARELRACAEAQETGGTSTGGSHAMVIHRTHPYPAYGGTGAVTGAGTGRQDAIGNPDRIGYESNTVFSSSSLRIFS